MGWREQPLPAAGRGDTRIFRKPCGSCISEVAGGRPDSHERLLWSRWILCRFARTPTVLELAGFDEDVLSHFPEFSDDFPLADTQAKIDAAIANISGIQQSNRIMPFIILRDWIMLRPAQGEFFIRGDVPVVIRGALVDDDAQIVYPMTPTHCFIATVLEKFPPRQV